MNMSKNLESVFLYACLFTIVGCSESVTLPYDLKLISNSSYLQIIDDDGWGVLSEPASIPDRKDIEVSKLLRYFDAINGLYVEMLTNRDELRYVIVMPKDETNLDFNYNIMNLQDFEEWASEAVGGFQWKNFR